MPDSIRTPNRQIRRLMLYVHTARLSAVRAAQVRCQIQLDSQNPLWCWLVDCHADCHNSWFKARTDRAEQRSAGYLVVVVWSGLVR